MFSKHTQGDHVFSWRHHWTLDNPLRRLLHPPDRILGPLARPGDTVIDTGCGTGFFSLHLARMVGDQGKVIAVDLQPEALTKLEEKAAQAGLGQVIETRQCQPDDIGLLPQADGALAMYMVHEVPEPNRYFRRMGEAIRPGGWLLLVEPLVHVSGSLFADLLESARGNGFEVQPGPSVLFSRSALLRLSC